MATLNTTTSGLTGQVQLIRNMKLYKVKVEKTVQGQPTELKHMYGAGYCVTIQAVRYGSDNPQSELYLYDAGGDEFMFKIPGQASRNTTTPEIPVTVRLPLSYLDSEGQNELIVWGTVDQIDSATSL